MKAGDKVICIAGFHDNPEYFRPYGEPQVGKMYCVTGVFYGKPVIGLPPPVPVGLLLAGKPTYQTGYNDVDHGWNSAKFRRVVPLSEREEVVHTHNPTGQTRPTLEIWRGPKNSYWISRQTKAVMIRRQKGQNERRA